MAVEGLAGLVLDRHRVELADPRTLGAEERHRVGDATTLDRIAVRVGELALKAADHLRRDGKHPPAPLVVGREHGLIFQIEPGLRLSRRHVQNIARCLVGLNGLPFSMPSDFNGSIIALSRVSQGSCCTKRSSDWKKRRS